MDGVTVVVAIVALALARNVDNRSIGGDTTTIEEHPHQASLTSTSAGGYFCGGAIIKSQHVLTAAHCFREKNQTDVVIRVGSSKHNAGGKTHKVEKINIHPKYYWDTLDYDIAVIKLDRPIKFGASTAPISLVTAGEKPRHGEMLTITGWGMTSYGSTKPPEVLQALRLPVVDTAHCASRSNNEFTDRMFCAGGGVNQGTYKGDSGSPVVNVKKKLAGIASWGHYHNVTGYPAVLTDLTNPSIQEFIKKSTL